MKVENTILDTIDGKRLTWSSPTNGKQQNAQKGLELERRKRGRPPRRWKKDVVEAMTNRGLQEDDWWNFGVREVGNGTRHKEVAYIYVIKLTPY